MVSAMYPDAASRSARLFERAKKVLPGGSTRQTVTFDPYPVYAVSGRGCMVTDADGVERIDFINNYSSMIHGHCHPRIVDALQRQAASLIAVGAPTESEIVLAELLAGRLPSVEQLRFCNSGSEAVMIAIQAARAFTGRPKIAKIEGAYHGGYDAMQVSLKPSPEDWGEPDPVPVAYAAGIPAGVLRETVVLPLNDVAGARRNLEKHKAELAGVIFDPIVGRMAFLEATAEYIAFLREWTRTNSVLLILDEVFSLRIDFHGAQGRYKVDPDITALGKIIGGGIAIGAVGGKAEVMAVFDASHGYPKLPHHGTYNANPLAMAAGLVSMELLDAAAIAHINALGDRLRDGLNRVFRDADVPAKAQGVGSMVAIAPSAEFTDYRGLARAAASIEPLLGRVHQELLNRGVLMMPRGSLVTSTPMTEAEIDRTLAAVGECFSSVPAR
jgi:glutamate-1-semialdehyde 2,1-aminomutase